MSRPAHTFYVLALTLMAGLAQGVELRPVQAPAPTPAAPVPGRPAQTQQPVVPGRPSQQPVTPGRPSAQASPNTPPAAAESPPSVRVRPGQVLFNFQDADIQAVIKTISQLTGRNFLVDPRVKGKVTIISAKPVSTAAAYQIFLSALKAQGFTAVQGPGGIVKVLPETDAKQSAPVTHEGRAPRSGDQLITQVVPVENGSAAQMLPLLRPLMAPGGLLTVYVPANTLVITDYADNVRRLLDVITRLDQPGASQVTIVPLHNASALDIAQLLTRLAAIGPITPQQPGVPSAGGEPSRVSVVPDLRTNSLLVRTDNPGRLEQIRALIEKLDVPAKAGGTTHVVYLRNAEAKKLADVLRALLAGETRAQAPATGAAAGAAAAPAASEASTIQADEASNALIISAPDAVYNNLRAVIERLDMRRAQVFVEALIAEVSSDRAAEFGVQWAAARPAGEGAIGGAANFPLTGQGIGTIAQNPLALGGGLSLAYIGRQITLPSGQQITGLGALARALEQDSETNILSTPNLLTLDNAEAKIVVGQNVPFVTGSYAQTGATTAATTTVNPFQTIERRDVGLTLKIKPQISEGGTIKLQIFQEVSAVVPSATTQAADLITTKRSLETTVLVDDGSTIVLGGLIDDNVQEATQAVPILSKIPLLGELFKYRQRHKVKTNLMVFLRPVIVRDVSDSEGFTADRYDYMRRQELNTSGPSSLVLPHYPTAVLPPLVQPPRKPKGETKQDEPAASNDESAHDNPDAGAAEPGNKPLLGPPDGPSAPSTGVDPVLR